MTAQAFFADRLDEARRASAATGVPVSTILAQWALETAFGTSRLWRQQNNPAGITRGGVSRGFAAYPSREAGVDAYIATLNHPRYAAVRQAGSGVEAARQLGLSPWDAAHYGGQGENLTRLIDQYGLTAYDPAGGGNPPAAAGGGVSDATVRPVGLFPSVSTIRDLVLRSVFVVGGVGLVVAGGWQMVGPAANRTLGKARRAAAAYATGGASAAAGAAAGAAAK